MRKFAFFFILLFAASNSFAQSCLPTSSTVSITIHCADFPYNYNGIIYYQPDEYHITMPNAAGCDSNITLELNGLPVTSYDTVTITQCQLPYYWYQDIFSAGTYEWNPLIGSPACYNYVYYRTVIVTPVDTPRQNVTVCASQLPFALNQQDYYKSGVYTNIKSFPATPQNPCDYTILTLTVLPSGSSSTNVTVCTNKLPYKWNGTNYTATGTYTAAIHTGGPCDSIATLNLTVTPNTTSTTSLSLCANQVPYLWNGQSLTASGIDTAIIAHAGCDSLAILNLTVKPLSTITSFSPAIGSKGQAVVINGTNFTNVSAVTFGGSAASAYTVLSPTAIIATVGSAASGAVAVTTLCNTSSLTGFIYNTSPGNMGVGTTNPTSKFTVGGGDIQITDIGSGIILKSPDGNCWRVTIDNNGNLIRTAIACP